jgi:predicted transcriptional regulator
VGSNPTPSARLVGTIKRTRYHNVSVIGTVIGMSTNLRLSPAAEAALRDAARKTGRSQQELLREAVDRYLGLIRQGGTRDAAVAAGLVRPPSPFRDTKPAVELDPGVSSLGLLARDDDR